MRRFLDTLILLAALLPVIGLAGNAEHGLYESRERIREAARQHALARAAEFPGEVHVTTSRLDSRLRLHRCEQPLSTYDSPNGLRPGRNVVGVRCDGPRPWKLYVTVNITTLQPVVVAARALARGQTLSAADLRLEKRDTSRLHRAYFTEIAGLLGQRTRRQIAAGRLLHPGLVERRRLVRRGTLVQLLARNGPLQVRVKGKALEDGTLGQRIRVRNTASGRTVTGEVIASGVVAVSP